MEYMIHEYPTGKFLFRMELHTPQFKDILCHSIDGVEHTYEILIFSNNEVILAKEVTNNVNRPTSITSYAVGTEPAVTRFNCC